MVTINKSEKEAIASRFPNAHIVRTMKQKSKRHRYYCEETPNVMRYLRELRGGETEANTKGADHYRNKKTGK